MLQSFPLTHICYSKCGWPACFSMSAQVYLHLILLEVGNHESFHSHSQTVSLPAACLWWPMSNNTSDWPAGNSCFVSYQSLAPSEMLSFGGLVRQKQIQSSAFTLQGSSKPRFGSCRAGPRTPRAPADVTETRKMVSGYYGRLLWQPQVSVRASISHSVGEREREVEGWREEPAERRRVEKSAEEVRCGSKHALGAGIGKRARRGGDEEERWEGERVLERCDGVRLRCEGSRSKGREDDHVVLEGRSARHPRGHWNISTLLVIILVLHSVFPISSSFLSFTSLI